MLADPMVRLQCDVQMIARWPWELGHTAANGVYRAPRASELPLQKSWRITVQAYLSSEALSYQTQSPHPYIRRPPPSTPSACSVSQDSSPSMASTQPSSSISTTTIVLATVGTLTTAALAYAIYFDQKRRSDPDFRRKLKKAQKQVSKAAKEEAVKAEKGQKEAIQNAVDEANEEGFPKDPEKTEEYFMEQVARGEGMCQDGESPCHFGSPWMDYGGRRGKEYTRAHQEIWRALWK